jgi:hypothetical protein
LKFFPEKIDEVIEAGTGGWQEDAGVTFLRGYLNAMKLRNSSVI